MAPGKNPTATQSLKKVSNLLEIVPETELGLCLMCWHNLIITRHDFGENNSRIQYRPCTSIKQETKMAETRDTLVSNSDKAKGMPGRAPGPPKYLLCPAT